MFTPFIQPEPLVVHDLVYQSLLFNSNFVSQLVATVTHRVVVFISSLSLLTQLLEKHKTTDSMVELLQLYEEEDQAYGGLLEASTQLYQYLLQPFRDMRELAMLRRQQIKVKTKKRLANNSIILGVRVKVSKKMRREC